MKKKIRELMNRHETWFQGLCLLMLSLFIAVVMTVSWTEIPSDIQIGRIARHDIRADRDYEIVDDEATANLIADAIAGVLPVFDWYGGDGKEMIIENRNSLEPWKERGVLIRQINDPEQDKFHLEDLGTISTLDEARNRLSEKMDSEKLPKKDKEEALQKVKTNLFFNEAETKLQISRVRVQIKPVIIKVQAGESIIRTGDHYEPRHVKIIEGMRREKTKSFGRMRFWGTFCFVALLLFLFVFSVKVSVRKLKLVPKDILFLATMLVVIISVERLFLFICGGVRNFLPFEVPLQSFYGVIPVAFGTLLTRMMLPLPLTFLFALVSSILAGFLFQGSLNYTLYYLVGCVLGIPLMAGVRTRSQILMLGLKLGIVNALTLLTLDLVNVTSLTGAISLEDSGIRVALAFMGGILSSVMTLILMPIFEALFNFLTPIKLLEYGSLNHPLLREMIVRAPGTYHHSHMVGTLAESAAEAIGADSLFARIASYFHDIGKMKKSAYFIENQRQGEDRHGNLSPSMSALIISSHVKDGLEMAREYKLPKRIADIIPQHQGTKLISYFYNKAKEQEDPQMHIVSERDYRYPGPKPQTREAGVILLADTVEASTRALKDRTPARLEEVVRNMINKNFIDGQLDECELTLKDLHTIAGSFIRILMGIYHHRIEYPQDLQEKMAKELALENHADKYSQSTPLRQDSTKEIT